MEFKEIHHSQVYMSGFLLVEKPDSISIGSGVLTLNGTEYNFAGIIIDIDRAGHFLYDLYFVYDAAADTCQYHLDKSYLDGYYSPAYDGSLNLIHTLMSLEVQPGKPDNGYFCFIHKSEIKKVKAGVQN